MNNEDKRCPTCHQTVKEKPYHLMSFMVKDLWKIYKYCKENSRHEFKRSELNVILIDSKKGATNTGANFGNWLLFGRGMMYRPETYRGRPVKGKGYWGFNLERIESFFAGDWVVWLHCYKDPLKPEPENIRFEGEGTIHDIPNLTEYLNEYREYIGNKI